MHDLREVIMDGASNTVGRLGEFSPLLEGIP